MTATPSPLSWLISWKPDTADCRVTYSRAIALTMLGLNYRAMQSKLILAPNALPPRLIDRDYRANTPAQSNRKSWLMRISTVYLDCKTTLGTLDGSDAEADCAKVTGRILT